MKKVSVFVATVMVLVFFNTNVLAYNSIPSNVTGWGNYHNYVSQQRSLWCWAACAENVNKVEYPGSSRTQADAVAFVKGSSSMNVAGSAEDTRAAARYISYNTKDYTVSGVLSYSFICTSTYNSHPIIAGFATSSVGHMVLLHGWGVSEDGDYLVFYHDPWGSNGFQSCTYSEMINGTGPLSSYVASVYVPYWED